MNKPQGFRLMCRILTETNGIISGRERRSGQQDKNQATAKVGLTKHPWSWLSSEQMSRKTTLIEEASQGAANQFSEERRHCCLLTKIKKTRTKAICFVITAASWSSNPEKLWSKRWKTSTFAAFWSRLV